MLLVKLIVDVVIGELVLELVEDEVAVNVDEVGVVLVAVRVVVLVVVLDVIVVLVTVVELVVGPDSHLAIKNSSTESGDLTQQESIHCPVLG